MGFNGNNNPQEWTFSQHNLAQEQGVLGQHQQGFGQTGSFLQPFQTNPHQSLGGGARGHGGRGRFHRGGRQGRGGRGRGRGGRRRGHGGRGQGHRGGRSVGPRGPIPGYQQLQAQSFQSQSQAGSGFVPPSNNNGRRERQQGKTEMDGSPPNALPQIGSIKPDPDSHAGDGPVDLESAMSAEIARLEAALVEAKGQIVSRDRELVHCEAMFRADAESAQREIQRLQRANEDLRLELDRAKAQGEAAKADLLNSQAATKSAEERAQQKSLHRLWTENEDFRGEVQRSGPDRGRFSLREELGLVEIPDLIRLERSPRQLPVSSGNNGPQVLRPSETTEQGTEVDEYRYEDVPEMYPPTPPIRKSNGVRARPV